MHTTSPAQSSCGIYVAFAVVDEKALGHINHIRKFHSLSECRHVSKLWQIPQAYDTYPAKMSWFRLACEVWVLVITINDTLYLILQIQDLKDSFCVLEWMNQGMSYFTPVRCAYGDVCISQNPHSSFLAVDIR